MIVGMSASHPIREWRNKIGVFADRDGSVMRQEELATMVGVRSSHLSQIETGDRKPSLALAAKLSNLTGIPISDLASFEKDRAPVVQAAE